MAKALLVTVEDLKRFSALDGSIDNEKVIQYISIAQDIYIENYLGTKLLTKIENDILNDTLIDPYLSLLSNYIKDMLIHFALYELMPFIAYTVSNKGVYKHSSDNSETVRKEEVDYLAKKHLDLAQTYAGRFVKYICNHTTEFPEYTANKSEDVHPSRKTNYGGWELGPTVPSSEELRMVINRRSKPFRGW